jgi:hypothetical protein
MSQPESEPQAMVVNVTIADASHLSLLHVNALSVRSSSDEFFFTLGIALPPDRVEIDAMTENKQIVAQPVFRFAVSRDTMEKFLTLMADQFEQQTLFRDQLYGNDAKATNEE